MAGRGRTPQKPKLEQLVPALLKGLAPLCSEEGSDLLNLHTAKPEEVREAAGELNNAYGHLQRVGSTLHQDGKTKNLAYEIAKQEVLKATETVHDLLFEGSYQENVKEVIGRIEDASPQDLVPNPQARARY